MRVEDLPRRFGIRILCEGSQPEIALVAEEEPTVRRECRIPQKGHRRLKTRCVDAEPEGIQRNSTPGSSLPACISRIPPVTGSCAKAVSWTGAATA